MADMAVTVPAAIAALPLKSNSLSSLLRYMMASLIFSTLIISPDCLIAASAIECDLLLLHNDRDFEAIAQGTSLNQTHI
jgi:predicted nucleic acid-binding protein